MSDMPVDWNALKENCAGDEGLVGEVIELFRAECPTMVESVRRAVAAKDAQEIRKAAHRIKGAFLSLGAAPAVAVAKEMEMKGTQGDLSAMEQSLAVMEVEVKRLDDELATFEVRSS